jgi:hypothetical protein
VKFSVFQVSRKGGREKNEDRMGYCYTRESGLFLLADGMGGHPEGEIAAQLALQTISALYQKEARPVVKDVTEFLSVALMAAHHQIIRYASEKGMLDTPRTTLVAAIVQGTHATWVHCGDSRLYVVRGNELLTRTRDHSYLEQQNAGVIRMDRSPQHPVHLPRLARPSPVFDVTGPCAAAAWATASCCAPTACGAACPTSDIVAPGLSQTDRWPRPWPGPGGRRPSASAASTPTTSHVIAMEWETPDTLRVTRRQLHRSGIRRGRGSPRPSRPA